MQKVRLLLHSIDTINEWVGRISCYLVVAVMVILTAEVTLRYGFNNPTSWSWDVSVQLVAAFALLAGGYNLLHRVHVRVDVLHNRFSDKVKVVADLVTSIFFFLLCIVLIRDGGYLAWQSLMAREYMVTVLAPPIYPLKILLVVASFLLFLQGAARFVRDLTFITTGKEI